MVPVSIAEIEEGLMEQVAGLGGLGVSIEGDTDGRSIVAIEVLQFLEAILDPA